MSSSRKSAGGRVSSGSVTQTGATPEFPHNQAAMDLSHDLYTAAALLRCAGARLPQALLPQNAEAWDHVANDALRTVRVAKLYTEGSSSNSQGAPRMRQELGRVLSVLACVESLIDAFDDDAQQICDMLEAAAGRLERQAEAAFDIAMASKAAEGVPA